MDFVDLNGFIDFIWSEPEGIATGEPGWAGDRTDEYGSFGGRSWTVKGRNS